MAGEKRRIVSENNYCLFKSLSIDAGMGAIQHLRRGKLKGLKPVQIYQKYYDVFFGPDEPAEGRVRHFTDLDQNDARKMSGHMLIVYLFSTEGDITPQQKAIERNIESQSVQRMLLATLYHSLPPEHRGRVSHPITGGKIECRYRMVGSGNGAAAAADTKKNED